MFVIFFILFAFIFSFSMPPPELPGIEMTDSEIALEHSKKLVQTQTSEKNDIYKNKGWTAPSLEEQLNDDETFIGMGQGAIFVPRFTENRLEPDYSAIKIDTLSKEYTGKEWTGKSGARLTVPYGDYAVYIGSGGMDKQIKYIVKVEEGKTTLIPPEWGGLVINTITEDGEYVSANYEIYVQENGNSYGKGFGLKQERVNDIKTWILPPQVYRITRSGENPSSISNYITVQVNSGELSYVELVFEDSTGTRLVAGGVQKIRSNITKDSYWIYGLRLGGSASYTTRVTLGGEQKEEVWYALGDLRLRAFYNRAKVFWLTQLYVRENMQWLNEEQKESQWSVVQDMMQLQSSVVYKFFEWIGPYARANAKTHIFNEYYWIDTSYTITIRKVNSNRAKTFTGKKILTGPPFDPLRVGEGTGLNLQPIISNAVDISAQTGVAARQTIRNNIFIPGNESKTEFISATNNIYDYGWENAISMRFSFRFLTLDLLGEVFFPKAKISDYVIEELSADFRFALTRFLELSYQHQLFDCVAAGNEEIKGNDRFESLNTVQLRLYINF